MLVLKVRFELNIEQLIQVLQIYLDWCEANAQKPSKKRFESYCRENLELQGIDNIIPEDHYATYRAYLDKAVDYYQRWYLVP